VLAFILFICAAFVHLGWPAFVGVSSIIQAAVFFIVHIINYFPDVLLAFIIVRLMVSLYEFT